MPFQPLNTSMSMFGASQTQQHAVYTDLRSLVGVNGASAVNGRGEDSPPSYREATREGSNESPSRRLSMSLGLSFRR